MKILLLSFLILTYNQNCFCQKTLSDTVRLKEIKIEEDFLHSEYVNLDATVNFLTKEQLNKTYSIKLIDGLSYLPGVMNIPDGLGSPTIVVRGQSQNRVNIFYNGIPLRSNTENTIPMEAIIFDNSNILIEKGTSSLLNGSNSGGSVININSSFDMTEKYHIELKSFWGDFAKQNYNLSFANNSINNLKILASVNYLKRNTFPLSENFQSVPAQNTKKRNNSDQKILEIIGSLLYTIDDNNSLIFTGVFENGEYGIPPSITRPRFRRMTQLSNNMFGLKYSSNFTKYLKAEINMYYTNLKDTLTEFTNINYDKVRQFSHWNDQSYGSKIIISKIFDSLNVINIGFDFKKDIHEQDWFTIKAHTSDYTIIPTIEYKKKFGKGISASAGISYNFIKPDNSSTGAIQVDNLSSVNYQISSSFSPTNKNFKFHLGYSRTTIFPRMRDLFGINLIPGYVANPNLKQETNDNFDIGINYHPFRNHYLLAFSLFYNPIKNLITDVKLNDTTTQTQNLNSSTFFGSELSLQYVGSGKTFANLSYTFLKALNSSDNRTSDYIAYRPEHYFKAALFFSINKYFDINATASYISRQYYDNIVNWNSIPDYAIFDIGVSTNPIEFFTFWFKVNNLLDKNGFSTFDQPIAGREFRVGINLSYQK